MLEETADLCAPAARGMLFGNAAGHTSKREGSSDASCEEAKAAEEGEGKEVEEEEEEEEGTGPKDRVSVSVSK